MMSYIHTVKTKKGIIHFTSDNKSHITIMDAVKYIKDNFINLEDVSFNFIKNYNRKKKLDIIMYKIKG